MDTIWRLYDAVRDAETESITDSAPPGYCVITPVDMLHPPSTDVLAQITAALRTLDQHGLLVYIG
jgi:hypothetical protein